MGAHRMTSESDIVEDLHSADPECEPGAAKIIMGRAAGEIERLREHKQQSLTLIKEQQNELEDMRAALDQGAKLESLIKMFVGHLGQVFRPQDFLCRTRC
jgi:hypothetical protein